MSNSHGSGALPPEPQLFAVSRPMTWNVPIGAWLALAPGRARGEERALAALGRSRWQRSAAAAAGGGAVAMVAAIAIATVARIDVEGFYPRVARPVAYRYEAGGFVSSDG